MSLTLEERAANNTKQLFKLSQIYGIFTKFEEVDEFLKFHETALDVEVTVPNDHLNYSLMIKNILQDDGDINFQVPSNTLVKLYRPQILGCTALHFAVIYNNLSCLNALLNLDANYTIQNSIGFTALRASIGKSSKKKKECLKMKGTLQHPIADAILDKHVETENFTNPICKEGISHFHIACMINHTQAVTLFLKNGVSANQSVNLNSSVVSGYTPLHFAARYCSCETMAVLLNHGADRCVRDAKGLVPLHLLLQYQNEILKALPADHLEKYTQFKTDLDTIDYMIDILTSNTKDYTKYFDDKGLTKLHIACMNKKTVITESYLEAVKDVNNALSFDSLIYPGFTPLHFAAYFNIRSFIILLNHGADIKVKNANSKTPFDILFETWDFTSINSVISSHASLRNISFVNDIKLVDAISCMHSHEAFEKLLEESVIDLNCQISLESPIYPGYTLLHLAVIRGEQFKNNAIFANVDHSINLENELKRLYRSCDFLTRACLVYDIDYEKADVNGMTPLHLAMRLEKPISIRLILHEYTKPTCNPVDYENLSHLHIATCTNNVWLVVNLLIYGANINNFVKSSIVWHVHENDKIVIAAGSTALHISVSIDNEKVTKILLENGADPTIKNADGLTPLHLAFKLKFKKQVNLLLQSPKVLTNNIISDDGLSFFHIACCADNLSAIIKYLKLGVDINSVVKENVDEGFTRNFIDDFAGFTALHFAAIAGDESLKTVKFLVHHGANINIKNKDGLTPFYLAVKHKYAYLEYMQVINYFYTKFKNENIKFCDDMGWTLLHIACIKLDTEEVKELLKSGVDVNAKISDECPIFSGNTPLHTLAYLPEDRWINQEVTQIAEILLNHGADITIKSKSKSKTLLHISYNEVNDDLIELFLKNHKNYSINPISQKGFSHFHVACGEKESVFVEEFLKNGIDVNHTIDYFVSVEAGQTPLHLAMNAGYDKVVEIVIKYGADVNARDCYGATPLHAAMSAEEPSEAIDNVKILLRTGKVDVNSLNVLGKSPLEILVTYHDKDPTEDYKMIELLLSHGALVNVYNPVSHEGLLGILLKESFKDKRIRNVVLAQATDLNYIDENTGSNVFHNIASVWSQKHKNQIYYTHMIDRLLQKDHDLDHRNFKGKTPLHTAVEYMNLSAIIALLRMGADINIVDNTGKTPFEYCERSTFTLAREAKKLFLWQIRNLLYIELYVSKANKVLYERLLHESFVSFGPRTELSICEAELVKMANITVENSTITVRNLLTENMIAAYTMMPIKKRAAIDSFFSNKKIMCRSFYNYRNLLQLQFRKMQVRLSLIDTSKLALEFLLYFIVPDLCIENIIRYLSNEDLCNLMDVYEDSFNPRKRRRVE